MAGEPSSSQAPAASPPPPLSQAGDGGPEQTEQAPPETLFKQKVRWSWAGFAGTRGNPCVRLFSWDNNDTGRVKGDDSEESSETDRQRDARVEEQAHQPGLWMTFFFTRAMF